MQCYPEHERRFSQCIGGRVTEGPDECCGQQLTNGFVTVTNYRASISKVPPHESRFQSSFRSFFLFTSIETQIAPSSMMPPPEKARINLDPPPPYVERENDLETGSTGNHSAEIHNQPAAFRLLRSRRSNATDLRSNASIDKVKLEADLADKRSETRPCESTSPA